MKIIFNVIKVETEKTVVEKERDKLFDECDMLRNQVKELTNKNIINTKSKSLHITSYTFKLLYLFR